MIRKIKSAFESRGSERRTLKSSKKNILNYFSVHTLTKAFKNPVFLFILYITAFAGILRFYNLNWDLGQMFHPDERNIANAVTKIKFFTQMNPEFFAYGSFTIYLTRAIADILVLATNDTSWVADWGKINLISRSISALSSTLTVPIIFLLGNKIANKKVGLIAATITAFTVSLIQTAHFGVTESFITMLAVLLCYLSLRLYEKPTLGNYIICALVWGVALASKTSAVSFIVFPSLAHLLRYKKSFKHGVRHSTLFALFGVISIILFVVLSPYSILTYQKFLESMDYESGVVSGRNLVVYVYQFIGTPSYLFQYINLYWQMGPIHILTIPSVLYVVWYAQKKRDKKLLIFLSFPLLYFLYVGSWHTKFVRYMIPIIPFIIVTISIFIVALVHNLNQIWKRIIVLALLISSVVWSFSFFSIYTNPQTRVEASLWIYKNIPPGTKIMTEHWDDGLPISLPDGNPSLYSSEQLTIYEPDNEGKIQYYADKLSSADYIIINSRRLYGTLMRLTDRYPLTSKYYRLLFDEKLGYKKVGEYTSYPTFLGLEINDDSSEESFQVYDHPKVLIYKNVEKLPSEEIINKLQ